MSKQAVVGILAHVDAGKTTLADQAATAAHHLSVYVEHAVYAALIGCAVGAAVYVVDACGAVFHSVDE